jgi:hypothetical protein
MAEEAVARQMANQVQGAMNENSGDLKGAMGGSGCSPEFVKQASAVLKAVTKTSDGLNNILSSPGGSIFSDDSLKKIYENAKKTNDTALLNEYIAEQNYIINKYGSGLDNKTRGTFEYNELLVNRYTAQGQKDLEDLTNKYIEINKLIKDLINVTDQQNIAVENMKKVMIDLDENNKELLSLIDGGKSDLYTYNRKSMYQSKLIESVENWTLIPVLIYWTLVILWVCIVMLYLKNVTITSVAILIGLILYPYFSTPIFLWILEKIQDIWNIIFAAIHNRVSA